MLLFCILIEQIHILAHQAKNEKIPEKSQIFKKNPDYREKTGGGYTKKRFFKKIFFNSEEFSLEIVAFHYFYGEPFFRIRIR
jgi:hypothetical protein